MQNNTFEITSVGRKYVHANLQSSNRSFKCRLHKNDIVANLEKEQVVHLLIEDQSVITDYGTDILFNPLAIIENLNHYNELKNKWIPFAIGDAKSGRNRTNAIKKTMGSIETYPWLKNEDFYTIAEAYLTEQESSLIAELSTLLDKPCRSLLDHMVRGWTANAYSRLKSMSEMRIRPNPEIDAVLSRAEEMAEQHKEGKIEFSQEGFKLDYSLFC
ncbi:hypothetical protein [Vibrio sp. HN007]|uniref:hypothetical protein n=1 Tax=Vibrio iocasae TaxID=3098914 RepID=UPI0035D3EAD4